MNQDDQPVWFHPISSIFTSNTINPTSTKCKTFTEKLNYKTEKNEKK